MSVVRHLAERLSRGRIFRRRLPPQYGGAQFFVSPECGLRYLKPDITSVDPHLLNLAREYVKPGAVVWDVGANLGLFSFAASGLAGPTGQVFAVEPDTHLIGVLRRSARLKNSSAAPVTVVPCAVTESLSLATFNIAERARASNFLDGHGASQTGGIREVQRVLTIHLDWLATQIPAPAIIKIDAEGADFRVLRGAEHLLREHKPTLIFEAYDEIADEVAAFLHGLGYTLFDAEQPAEARAPIPRAVNSTLAIANA
jgi:FkbM family methyltransferase